MDYDAVIFDNDGVLVEGTKRHQLDEVFVDLYAEYGVDDPSKEDVESPMIVNWMTLERLVTIGQQYDIDIHDFWRKRDDALVEYQVALIEAGKKSVFPDVESLRQLDADLGIVSNNQDRIIDFIVEHFELGDIFDTHYGLAGTIAGITRKKPNPYYVERAIADLDATTALMVGDSESDLVAAACAGIDSAFIDRSGEHLPLDIQPDYRLTSLTELEEIVS